MNKKKNGLNKQLIAMEDMLKEIYSLQADRKSTWELNDLVCELGVAEEYTQGICKALVDMDWIQKVDEEHYHLTPLGNERAVELIRAHRLWEQYLSSHEGYHLEELHAAANQHEHSMTDEEVATLDDTLGHPAWDPHGHAIPEKGMAALPKAGEALSNICVPGHVLRVVAVDDRPEDLLAQFVALGIVPGARLTVLKLGSHTLEIKIGDHIFSLASSAAQHIFVVPVSELPVPLGKLKVGQHAQIIELKGEGRLQRRLLSMGFVPGAFVSVVRQAPLGDPVQYRVKKSNIALRRKEANMLLVK